MKHNKVWHSIMHELVYTTNLFITAKMEKEITEFSLKYNSLTNDEPIINDFIKKLKGEPCGFDDLMKNEKFRARFYRLKDAPAKQKQFLRKEVREWTDGHH